jgi:amidase
VPITVKESFAVAGLPATLGDRTQEGILCATDSTAVQKLKAAGAIVFGKTNLPTNNTDWQSYNDLYGTTNNPWDRSRTAGGSSGGSAAAVAAGMTPLELGSGCSGSIRVPASFCGVFG